MSAQETRRLSNYTRAALSAKPVAERRASGYYEPAQVAARDEAARIARKEKRLAELRADNAKVKAKLDAELAVQIALVEHFGDKVNAIYYTHSNELSFNWSSLDALVTREQFDGFVAAVSMSSLPQDIKFAFNAKPKR